jgi:hypothetical protein
MEKRSGPGIDGLLNIMDEKESKPLKQDKQSKLNLQDKPDKQSKPTRQTYYLDKEMIEKIRAYAWWDRLGVSEVVNIALMEFFKGKKVKPIPQKRPKP